YQDKDVVVVVSCYDIDESKAAGEAVVYTLEAKSTALSAVREFAKGVRKQKRNARDFQVVIIPKDQKNDKGSWYTFEFTEIEQLPSSLKADVEAAYQALEHADTS